MALVIRKGRDVFILARTTHRQPPTELRRWRAVKSSGTVGELYDVMVEYIGNAMQKEALFSCAMRWWVVLDDKAVYSIFGPSIEKSMVNIFLRSWRSSLSRTIGVN